MKLIDEIIQILSSENCNLENALIKTKVLLHKMGEKSLLMWINQELNGYHDDDTLPEYRKIGNNIVGSFQNRSTQYNNHEIPIMHLDTDEYNFFTNIPFTHSISTIEEFLNTKDDSIYFGVPLEYAALLMKSLDKSLSPTSIKRQISKSQIKGLLTQIRSRLLDFILELSIEFPEEISDKEIKQKSHKIRTEELFNNTILGDNTTIIVGNNNVHKSEHIKNDFNALAKILQSYSLNFQDIKDLEHAIGEDKKIDIKKVGDLGLSVKGWVKKISNKVSDKVTIDTIIGYLNNFY